MATPNQSNRELYEQYCADFIKRFGHNAMTYPKPMKSESEFYSLILDVNHNNAAADFARLKKQKKDNQKAGRDSGKARCKAIPDRNSEIISYAKKRLSTVSRHELSKDVCEYFKNRDGFPTSTKRYRDILRAGGVLTSKFRIPVK